MELPRRGNFLIVDETDDPRLILRALRYAVPPYLSQDQLHAWRKTASDARDGMRDAFGIYDEDEQRTEEQRRIGRASLYGITPNSLESLLVAYGVDILDKTPSEEESVDPEIPRINEALKKIDSVKPSK